MIPQRQGEKKKTDLKFSAFFENHITPNAFFLFLVLVNIH